MAFLSSPVEFCSFLLVSLEHIVGIPKFEEAGCCAFDLDRGVCWALAYDNASGDMAASINAD